MNIQGKQWIRSWKVELLISFFTGINLFLGSVLNLTNDGAYYWVWSRHLGLSYFEHPPMIAYFNRFFTELFGNNNLAVRLTPVLCVLLTSILIYRIVEQLYDDPDHYKAFSAVLLFHAMPIFTALSLMSLPDLPFMLFYTAALYFLVRLIREENPRLWYWIGLMVGLGLLSKYNMVLVYPGIFLFLITDSSQHHWFRRKELYLGFFFSLALFLPVMIWNAQHDWASFSYHLFERHEGANEIEWGNVTVFIVLQFLLTSPLLFPAFFTTSLKNVRRTDVKLLFFYGTPILFTFLISSLFSEFKLHWTAMTYIPLLILYTGYNCWHRYVHYSGIAVSLLISLFLQMNALYPLIPLNPEKNFLMDFHGWDRVAPRVQAEYKALNKAKNNQSGGDWFLYSSRYQISSQLHFYLPENQFVYSINASKEQYHFWEDRYDPDDLKGKNGLFITHSVYRTKPENMYDCERVKRSATIEIQVGSGRRTYFLDRCYGFDGFWYPDE